MGNTISEAKMKKLSYDNIKSLEVEEEIFGFDRWEIIVL